MRTRASLSWYFYPRPPRGGRRASLSVVDESFTFLSTPSARRATWGRYRLGLPVTDFYPRPPRGGRRDFYVQGVDLTEFLSTPSARRATRMTELKDSRFTISIHALREEGDLAKIIGHALNAISIHALREEGDPARIPLMSTAMHFYPRPPRGGRPTKQVVRSAGINFYPRPPRGGRLLEASSDLANRVISIHALREEGDPGYPAFRPDAGGFLSTPSARRATIWVLSRLVSREISIHALREEGDLPCAAWLLT